MLSFNYVNPRHGPSPQITETVEKAEASLRAEVVELKRDLAYADDAPVVPNTYRSRVDMCILAHQMLKLSESHQNEEIEFLTIEEKC